MANSIEYIAFEALHTLLTGLTVANGYSFTVAEVLRVARSWDDPSIQRPSIGVYKSGASYQHNAGSIRCTIPVEIVLHMDAPATDQLRSQQITNAREDILKRIGGDADLGSDATQIMIQTSNSDETEPDVIYHDGGSVSLVVGCSVVLHVSV